MRINCIQQEASRNIVFLLQLRCKGFKEALNFKRVVIGGRIVLPVNPANRIQSEISPLNIHKLAKEFGRS